MKKRISRNLFALLTLTFSTLAVFLLTGSTLAATQSSVLDGAVLNPLREPVAQFGSDNQCSALVTEALERVGEACDSLGRNQACYGNQRVDARFRSAQQIVPFINNGDIADLSAFQRIATTPFSDLLGTWGIAVIKAQATLPDALPGQNVTMVLYGETSVENPSAEMNAVTVRTRVGGLACENLPESGVVIQSPRGQSVEMTLNGVEVRLGSTMHISASEDGDMVMSLLEGNALITAQNETRILIPGAEVWVGLGGDDGFTAQTVPSELRPFNVEEMARLPLSLLDEPVIVPPPIVVTSTGTPQGMETATPSACVPRADWFTYVVQPGDTFGGITQRANVPLADLLAANCLPDATRLIAGWTLRVPRRITGPAGVTPRATATTQATPTVTPTSVGGVGTTNITLTAYPSEIYNGGCTDITWAIATDNTTYTADLNGTPVGPSGLLMQCPTVTTTYTLTLTFASGQTRSASIVVTVITYPIGKRWSGGSVK